MGPDEIRLWHKATPYELLVTARMEGLTISATDDERHIRFHGRNPEAVARWKPLLLARKAEVLHELLYGICDRCGERGRRLVPSWWADPTPDQMGAVCGECEAIATTGLDVSRLAGG